MLREKIPEPTFPEGTLDPAGCHGPDAFARNKLGDRSGIGLCRYRHLTDQVCGKRTLCQHHACIVTRGWSCGEGRVRSILSKDVSLSSAAKRPSMALLPCLVQTIVPSCGKGRIFDPEVYGEREQYAGRRWLDRILGIQARV